VVVLKTIDAHVGGSPLRMIVEGCPAPRGRTLADKRVWAKRHLESIRRILMLEPRGHRDMRGALLTESASPAAHAGMLFMDADGFGTLSGHAVIAAATIALERGLIEPGGDGKTLVLDTPAGTVRATASWRDEARGDAGRRVERVAFVSVPSFVLHGGLDLSLGARKVRVDVAFGGAFYAIVDAEAVGVPLDASHVPELRRAGAAIVESLNRATPVEHPLDGALGGVQGAVFTAPPRTPTADLRSVTVLGSGAIDRSASGTGTAAVMAVLDAMGLVGVGQPFVQEGLAGMTLSARVTARTAVGAYPAIVPEIDGAAWITGEHVFTVDDADPLAEGFVV
jgi:proline racemase